MQPFDYTIKTQNAGDAFNQGVARTSGLMTSAAEYRQAQQLANAQQIANEQAMQKRADFQAAAENPSYEGMQKLMVKYPELSEQFKRSLDSLGEQRKQGVLSSAFSISQALEKNNPEAALKLVDSSIEAAKNSKDAATERQFQTARDMILSNPKAALFSFQGMLYSGLGGDKYAAARKNLGEDERASELQPALVAKGKSEAEKEVFDVRKTKAESIIKEVEAKFAPQVLLADLGLRKAQTNASNASAASSYASASASKATAARANAEAKQITSGVIPSDKRPEAESKFRDEYSKRTAGYQEVKQSYGRVLSSNNDAAGDISMIFGYMKMLDPGSVVREGEFATAQNAAGIDTRLQNVYNKALKGERLTDGQRKMFKGQAESLYKTAAKQEDEIRSGIGRIASGYGLNTKNIFYTDKESVPGSPVGSTLPGGFKVLGVER